MSKKKDTKLEPFLTTCQNLGQSFLEKHGEAAFNDMVDIVEAASPSSSHSLSWKMNKLKARTLNLIEASIDDEARRTSACRLVKGFVADAFNEFMDEAHRFMPNNGLTRVGVAMSTHPAPGGVPFMREDE